MNDKSRIKTGKRPRIKIAIALTLMLLGGLLLSPASTFSSPSPVTEGTAENNPADRVPWPHEVSDLDPDPAVTFGRLDNGFRYVLMANQRPENRVSLHLYIDAGSLNETEDQRGLAHFLEHMLFNGSTHFPPGELVRYFQSIGMQFGNDANAHTGFDETVYDIILPAGDEKNLKEGLLVMQDYAMGALLLEEEVDRERNVILAEMRTRDSVDYRTFKATLNFELPDMLISRRMPIGKKAVIEKANREQLKRFYDAWYRPDNAVLVMVGDFSPPLAEQLIKDQFSEFVPRAQAPALAPMGTISHKGLETFYHHEPEKGGTTVGIEVIRATEPKPDSLDLQRKQLIEQMADDIVQNRLDQRLKKSGTPFTSAAIGSGTYLDRVRYAEISADSSPENWSATLAALEQELRRAILFGFTEAELERVKKDTLSMIDNAVRESPTRNSTSLARTIIRHLARNRVFQSPQQEKANLAPMVASATLEDLQQAFKSNWPGDQRLVLVTGNVDLKEKANNGPQKQIRDAYLASAVHVVQRPEAQAAAVFPYLPPPEDTGHVAFREKIEDLGMTRVRLDNGVWVNVKQTDYSKNEVLANLIFGRGKSAEPESLPGITLIGEATMNESGLGQLNTSQLEQALAGKSTGVDFRVGETHCGLSANSVPDELELMFQLLYAHLLDPGFREDALKLVRERMHQDYRSLSSSIDGMMRIKGLRFLAGGDSRFGLPTPEQIDAITLDDIQGWIQPQLKKAPLELSVVGDVDIERVIDLARRYLGSLPRRNRDPGAVRSDLPAMPTGKIERITVDTEIPKAMVVAAWQTEDFWDINRTRRLSVLADVFSERLRQRIREKLGASYSPYAFNRASRAYAGYGVFQAYISVSPDQTDAVLKEVNAIAARLAGSGVTEDELKRAIDPILTSIRELRQTNGYWLNSVMTASARHPQQIEWARSFLDDYAAVTVQELNRIAATYLTRQRSAAIIIRPKEQDPKDDG